MAAAATGQFRRFEQVWFTPRESWASFRAGGAYRVMFVAPDAESPDVFTVIRAHGTDYTVCADSVRAIEHDHYGNPIIPNPEVR